MSTLLPTLAGYALDSVVGDPRWLPHPVRGIGWLIGSGERLLNRGGRAVRIAAGTLLTVGVVGVSTAAAWGLQAGASQVHPLAGHVVSAIGIGLFLARKSLADEAGTAIYRRLALWDLPGARQAVSWVVGRDTDRLDEAGVARAAIETLAENLSDGVIAPLLFALVGGFPGITAYKAVNTLDSMIGHMDNRYRYFGRAAARCDDVLNWIPARISFLALVAAAALGRRNARGAWRSALADSHKHRSPNAGWPEAAMAGALGIRLGGLNHYDGEPHLGPVLNETGRAAATADVRVATILMHLAAHLTLAAGLLTRWIFATGAN